MIQKVLDTLEWYSNASEEQLKEDQGVRAAEILDGLVPENDENLLAQLHDRAQAVVEKLEARGMNYITEVEELSETLQELAE